MSSYHDDRLLEQLRDPAFRAAFEKETRRLEMDNWVNGVVKLWKAHWEGRLDHRYGRDFHAFLGESVLTDFNLPHHDQSCHH